MLVYEYINESYFLKFLLFFVLVMLALVAYWKNKAIMNDVKIELLEENLSFVRHSINKLDKKFRKFKSRHSGCFPRKTIFLYR